MIAAAPLLRAAASEGPRVRSRWPEYAADEIAAVAEVLRSGRVNALHHGEHGRAFERAFADFCEMPHALTVANGTLGLECALRILGIGSGDEVIVPARSFVASASCVVACGAKPVFADVDAETQNLTVATIAPLLTARTRAIIAVHLGGHPCEMEAIVALAQANGCRVIEDCAQAHGARHHGRPAGSFGDAAVFSFCTDKIISTGGEGGMILMRDRALWERAWSYSNHGKDYEKAIRPGGAHFRWVHDDHGSNIRMTEMQSAIGLAQLAKLPDWIAARRRNAAALIGGLEGIPGLRVSRPAMGSDPAYYSFYAFVEPRPSAPAWSRDAVVAGLNARGVPAQVGICPEIYVEKAFVRTGLAPPARLPVAHALGRTSVKLPVDHTLDPGDMACIADAARDVWRALGGQSA